MILYPWQKEVLKRISEMPEGGKLVIFWARKQGKRQMNEMILKILEEKKP